MLTLHLILALAAAGGLAWRPASAGSAVAVGAIAAVELALGASAGPALAVVVPLVAFLSAALTLAALVERSGLALRTAEVLAGSAGGSVLRLYLLTCLLCAVLTAIVSLEGANVLAVPILLRLARRDGAPLAPLFLGAVLVANAASMAVPQGNPT